MTAAAIASAKAAVWSLWGFDRAAPAAAPTNLAAVAEDVVLHASAPIGRRAGRDAVADAFAPLAAALPRTAATPQLFLGGAWRGETGGDEIWVATHALWRGGMAAPWLGIAPPAAGGSVVLRAGAFHRVEADRVVELRILWDVLDLARQCDALRVDIPFEGAVGPPPGPADGDGVRRAAADPGESRATLDLVEAMLGGCNRLDGADLASMGMSAFWREDMGWYGPYGVGACRGFDEFQRFAQGPSVASFPDRRGGFHVARFADGPAACFTGWPSLRGAFTGAPFRGLAPTGGPIGMNIMDFYIRRGDKLAENWVMIDFIDFWAQCGVDLLPGAAT